MEKLIRSWATPVTTLENTINGLGLVWHDGTETTRTPIGSDKWESLAPEANIVLHRNDVIAAFNHDFSRILGRQSNNTLRLATTDKGLHYEIVLNEKDSEHQSIKAKIDRGDVAGSSATFIPRAHRWDGNTLLYTELELIEIGPVTMPAMTASTAFSIQDNLYARLALETKKRLEKMKSLTLI